MDEDQDPPGPARTIRKPWKPGGLELLRMELEAENPRLVIPLGVRWAGAWKTLEENIRSATAVVAIKDVAIACDVLQRVWCRAAGTRPKAERYINAGPRYVEGDVDCRCHFSGHVVRDGWFHRERSHFFSHRFGRTSWEQVGPSLVRLLVRLLPLFRTCRRVGSQLWLVPLRQSWPRSAAGP